ncbi:MFS transporter [Saccharolobus shibatae]|uniref:Nitrate/nitrite transporter n=1 Tax=Saccharolobus shibatae TaxID=2286 RepID=A0A8F5BVR3_9CREN|nr:MFS transporter [Saccharolobus shibatae]QXJ32214.1 Nitrate/nitrite transporter [Saccharolobus shibatae]QXJ35238.1 Nitrate/nitrite transporter [Saccharolobus shibatae]
MSHEIRKKEIISKESLKGNPNLGLIAGTIAFFAGFAAVALFGTTAHLIANYLNLSIVEIGWLVAIPLVTGAFLRIPFSALVDKYGGRRILITQLIIALAGMIGLIFTLRAILSHEITNHLVGYAFVMTFGAIAGTGISTFSSGITYVSYWFPQKRQGFALGFYAGIGNTAPGIFTAILPFTLASIGLIYSYATWASFLGIMIVVFSIVGFDAYYFQIVKKKKNHNEAIRIAREAGEELFPTGSATKSLVDAAKVWSVWLLVVMYFISFGGFEALTEWLPTYWTKYVGVSTVEAGILTGILFSLVTALIRVLGGWLGDRVGGEKAALASYIVMIFGSLIMIFSGANFTLDVAGEIVMALGMGAANGAVYKLVPKYAPHSVGGASGWVGGLGSAGGLLIPPAMAAFVQTFGVHGYSLGFIIFTIFSLVSIAFSLILKRYYNA